MVEVDERQDMARAGSGQRAYKRACPVPRLWMLAGLALLAWLAVGALGLGMWVAFTWVATSF